MFISNMLVFYQSLPHTLPYKYAIVSKIHSTNQCFDWGVVREFLQLTSFSLGTGLTLASSS